MIKVIFITLLTVIFSPSFAQLIDELPKDENGKLNFNEVVTMDSVSKDELFLRARQFFAETFKNAKNVLQMEDKEAGIIIGKAYGDIAITNTMSSTKEQMWFTMKIQVKDDRYKYEVYDIHFKTYADRVSISKVYQADDFFDKRVYYKDNGKPKPIAEKHKEQTVLKANAVAGIIKDAMKKAAVSSGSNSKSEW